jgi:hypothetical protein
MPTFSRINLYTDQLLPMIAICYGCIGGWWRLELQSKHRGKSGIRGLFRYGGESNDLKFVKSFFCF